MIKCQNSAFTCKKTSIYIFLHVFINTSIFLNWPNTLCSITAMDLDCHGKWSQSWEDNLVSFIRKKFLSRFTLMIYDVLERMSSWLLWNTFTYNWLTKVTDWETQHTKRKGLVQVTGLRDCHRFRMGLTWSQLLVCYSTWNPIYRSDGTISSQWSVSYKDTVCNDITSVSI